ncbi:MAG: MFS transporter [Chloroflexi bacterium]|nr:MFS transporter [Chloroflexota bacterium]
MKVSEVKGAARQFEAPRVEDTGASVEVTAGPAATAVMAERRESPRLMIGLSAGHAVKHFCQGSLLIIMPSIRGTLGMSDVEVGGMFTAQQISSGAVNAPAGILTDMFRRRVALILTVSMVCVALAYLLVGVTRWYGLLIFAAVILGAGTSLWHSPAFATLAARYPERRGLAMAAHLTGAQMGDTLAPVLTGLVLGGIALSTLAWGGFHWRSVALFLVVPAGLTSLMVATFFRSGAVGAPTQVSLRQYLAAALRLTRNPGVLGMVALHGMRGATHSSFQVFLVLYMSDVLGYSSLLVGVHISLLTLAGVASTPLFGAISDRIGRRPLILFNMTAVTAIIASFTWIEGGWPFAVMLALLGVVLFSVMPTITAAAMDVTEKGSEGTSIALMFAGGAVIGAVAPVAAGAINSSWGFQGVVLFASAVAAAGVLTAIVVPMARRRG